MPDYKIIAGSVNLATLGVNLCNSLNELISDESGITSIAPKLATAHTREAEYLSIASVFRAGS